MPALHLPTTLTTITHRSPANLIVPPTNPFPDTLNSNNRTSTPTTTPLPSSNPPAAISFIVISSLVIIITFLAALYINIRARKHTHKQQQQPHQLQTWTPLVTKRQEERAKQLHLEKQDQLWEGQEERTRRGELLRAGMEVGAMAGRLSSGRERAELSGDGRDGVNNHESGKEEEQEGSVIREPPPPPPYSPPWVGKQAVDDASTTRAVRSVL